MVLLLSDDSWRWKQTKQSCFALAQQGIQIMQGTDEEAHHERGKQGKSAQAEHQPVGGTPYHAVSCFQKQQHLTTFYT